MPLQLAYVAKEKPYSADSGVIYLDLPAKEMISAIGLDFQATVGGTVPTTTSLIDRITKIEVLLEGAKVAFSADAQLASFLHFFQAGTVPKHHVSYRPTDYSNVRPLLHFGRFPGDPEYMLDTSKYSSAQLAIEYALNTTYEATGTTVLTVYILRPYNTVEPKGFIRSRKVHVFTGSGTAGETQVDLPTGLPWFGLGFRKFLVTSDVITPLTDVDVDIDEGRMHLYQGRIEDLLTEQARMFGHPIVGNYIYAYPTGDTSIYCLMGDVWMAHTTLGANVAEWINNHGWYDGKLNLNIRVHDGTVSATARSARITPMGLLPYSGWTVFDGRDAPFPAPDHSDATIKYTLGAYSPVISTWLQEVVEGVL